MICSAPLLPIDFNSIESKWGKKVLAHTLSVNHALAYCPTKFVKGHFLGSHVI